MCDHCGNPQTPEEIGKELSEMEMEYLGARHGAIRIKRIVTGMDEGRIAIAQEIEINDITEDGVTQKTKVGIVYVTPGMLIQMIDALVGEDDDG